jgi:predicted aspartyl protease
MGITFASGTFVVALVGPALAGPLEDSYAAYQRGDYAEVVRLVRPLAEHGNPDAQQRLGSLYELGVALPQDYAQALIWYRRAANRGYARAQFSLGFLYENGKSGSVDYAKALFWYRKAADQGFAGAQLSIGGMYSQGLGVPQDSVQAAVWFNRFWANSDKGWPETPAVTPTNASSAIPLQEQGGTFVLPVLINNAITLSFVVDSGAADVSIPRDVYSTLIRSGTISEADVIGQQTYRLADGSMSPETTFRIRVLKVGDRELENVRGSVAPESGTLLLGQSFLSRFNSWSIDNERHVLLLR